MEIIRPDLYNLTGVQVKTDGNVDPHLNLSCAYCAWLKSPCSHRLFRRPVEDKVPA